MQSIRQWFVVQGCVSIFHSGSDVLWTVLGKNKKAIGKYADVFTPVGVTGGLHLRYNDPMTKKYICIHVQKNDFCTHNT